MEIKSNLNTEIRAVQTADREVWMSYDKHLSYDEFDRKVRDKQGYVISVEGRIVGVLRYNLFWDNTPFCNLIFIDDNFRGKGLGKALMDFWEEEMASFCYDWILVSTRIDESAQHFYRARGYYDCGNLLAPNQPMELFLGKHIYKRID